MDTLIDSEAVQTHCCFFIRLKMLGSKYGACCIKADRKDRIFSESQGKIEKEFEIGRLLKKINVFEGVIKHQLSELEWREAERKYSLIHYKEKKPEPFEDDSKADDKQIFQSFSIASAMNI